MVLAAWTSEENRRLVEMVRKEWADIRKARIHRHSPDANLAWKRIEETWKANGWKWSSTCSYRTRWRVLCGGMNAKKKQPGSVLNEVERLIDDLLRAEDVLDERGAMDADYLELARAIEHHWERFSGPEVKKDIVKEILAGLSANNFFRKKRNCRRPFSISPILKASMKRWEGVRRGVAKRPLIEAERILLRLQGVDISAVEVPTTGVKQPKATKKVNVHGERQRPRSVPKIPQILDTSRVRASLEFTAGDGEPAPKKSRGLPRLRESPPRIGTEELLERAIQVDNELLKLRKKHLKVLTEQAELQIRYIRELENAEASHEVKSTTTLKSTIPYPMVESKKSALSVTSGLSQMLLGDDRSLAGTNVKLEPLPGPTGDRTEIKMGLWDAAVVTDRRGD